MSSVATSDQPVSAAIRTPSLGAVQRANSGHARTPMAMASTLVQRFLGIAKPRLAASAGG
jgi:transketolase